MKRKNIILLVITFIFILNIGCIGEPKTIIPEGVIVEYGITIKDEPYIFENPETSICYQLDAIEKDELAFTKSYENRNNIKVAQFQYIKTDVLVNNNETVSTWVGTYECNSSVCQCNRILSCGSESVLNIAMISPVFDTASLVSCHDPEWREYYCKWRGMRTKIYKITGNYYVYICDGPIRNGNKTTVWLIIKWIGSSPMYNCCSEGQDNIYENYQGENQLSTILIYRAMNWDITIFDSGEENE